MLRPYMTIDITSVDDDNDHDHDHDDDDNNDKDNNNDEDGNGEIGNNNSFPTLHRRQLWILRYTNTCFRPTTPSNVIFDLRISARYVECKRKGQDRA